VLAARPQFQGHPFRSEPTVRTHLLHIFSKTNTLRQADLLRLLQNSTPAGPGP
jgi:hypothetical protein